MFKKGFICTYYLLIFTVVTTLISALYLNINNRIKLTGNIKILNNCLSEEAAVLSFIKCEILNNRLKNGTYDYCGISFCLDTETDSMTVTVSKPYPEIIIITLENQMIYDYQTVRNFKTT